MSEHDELKAAFGQLLAPSPAATADPIVGVRERVSRRQQRRTAAATAFAVVVAGGLAAGGYALTRSPGTASADPISVVAIDPKLQLDITVGAAVDVGADEQLTVRLHGTGEGSETYGWRVAWGDGGLDRVFGSADCQSGPAGAVAATRVFAHRYVEAGPRRIIVEVTRCGAVLARALAHISVDPAP